MGKRSWRERKKHDRKIGDRRIKGDEIMTESKTEEKD